MANKLWTTSLIWSFLFVSLSAIAASAASETAPGKTTAQQVVGGAQSPLPHCVNDVSEIAKIQDAIKANSGTEFKYKGYREALQSDTDSESLARLIYSETVAANCPTANAHVAPPIADVIGNRIRVRHGDVKGVVFQRDQFASSLNNYSESRFADFLCPKDLVLWQQSMQLARKQLASGQPQILDRSTAHYFLYKHSPRWTQEPWKYPEDRAGSDSVINGCVKFFKNPRWK